MLILKDAFFLDANIFFSEIQQNIWFPNLTHINYNGWSLYDSDPQETGSFASWRNGMNIPNANLGILLGNYICIYVYISSFYFPYIGNYVFVMLEMFIYFLIFIQFCKRPLQTCTVDLSVYLLYCFSFYSSNKIFFSYSCYSIKLFVNLLVLSIHR